MSAEVEMGADAEMGGKFEMGADAASKALAKKYRAAVNAALDALLTPNGIVTDERIPPQLAEQMRYAFLNGGKRIRPVFCLAACQAVCGEWERALPAALAIEILHTYTLVHDDLPCMDNDEYRRGVLTNHAKFGYAQAVLTGDALQALAFQLAAASELDAEKKAEIIEALAAAASAGGVIGGQWLDLFSTPPYSGELVGEVAMKKTADLLFTALEMGAIAGGATETQRNALRHFGMSYGIAFQATDDLLDADDPAKQNEMSFLRALKKEQIANMVAMYTRTALSALETTEWADADNAVAVEWAGADGAAAIALLREGASKLASRTE